MYSLKFPLALVVAVAFGAMASSAVVRKSLNNPNDKPNGNLSLKVDEGAVGNGVANDTIPWQRALLSLANGGILLLPCGTYKITSTTTINLAAGKSLTLQGMGSGCTKIHFSELNGPGVTVRKGNKYSSFHVRDLSLTTDTNVTTSIAISLIGAMGDLDPGSSAKNDFSRVVFRGSDGFLVLDHFGVDVFASLVSNIDFNQVSFFGGSNSSTAHIGAYIVGHKGSYCAGGACYAVHYSFNNCYFAQFNYGIQIGDVAQGFTVNGSNFNVGNFGIYAAPGQYANDGLSVYGGSQFNTEVAGIAIYSKMESVQAIGNFFVILNRNDAGVMLAAHDWQITGNHFEGIRSPSGAVGVNVLAGGSFGVITGNSYSYLPTGNYLQGSNVKVQSNVYDNVKNANNNKGNANTVGAVSP